MQLLDRYLEELQTPQQEVAPIMLALSAGGLTLSAYNIYKQYFTKASRACKDLPPREKGVCMWNFKMQGKQKEIEALKGSFNKCAKTKNPQECKQKLLAKTKKVGQQMQFIAARLKELRKQKYD